jgi:hypothetical protein
MRGHVDKGFLAVVLGTVGFLPTLGDAAAPEVTEPPFFRGSGWPSRRSTTSRAIRSFF